MLKIIYLHSCLGAPLWIHPGNTWCAVCGIRVGMLVIKAGTFRDAANGFKYSLRMIGIKESLMFNMAKKGEQQHVEFGFSVIKENTQ